MKKITILVSVLVACSVSLPADLVLASGKPTTTTTATYPPARYWHAFTSNGGQTAATSRLYMLGGTGGAASSYACFNDLWSYSKAGSTNAAWTLVTPTGTSRPGPRAHVGWSCGGGRCVAANGTNCVGATKETWVYTESSKAWTQINCRRYRCPSARLYPTMAYDPVRRVHVHFGGALGNTATSDTHTFDPATLTWTLVGTATGPSPRRSAAAVYVPELDRVVLFGGQVPGARVLNDLYSWNGRTWESTAASNPNDAPYLHSHSMSWDPVARRLIVTGGFVDVNDTPNARTWYVTFSTAAGASTATWTLASGIGCQSTAGSSDPVVHEGAVMAYDVPAGVQVTFGGMAGSTTYPYGNTVECR